MTESLAVTAEMFILNILFKPQTVAPNLVSCNSFDSVISH